VNPSAEETTPRHRGRLSDDLDTLLQHSAGTHITLGKIIELLGQRGHAAVLLILSAPFLINPIPGLSTAFGAVMILLSLCVIFNLKPRLPYFFAKREISDERLTRIVHAVERVLKRIEKFAKPRWEFMLSPSIHWLAGLSLLSAAFIFALPLPIPGNNIPPALCMVLLSLGILERDGKMILAGIIYNLIMWVLLIVFSYVIIEALNVVWDKVAKYL